MTAKEQIDLFETINDRVVAVAHQALQAIDETQKVLALVNALHEEIVITKKSILTTAETRVHPVLKLPPRR